MSYYRCDVPEHGGEEAKRLREALTRYLERYGHRMAGDEYEDLSALAGGAS